MNIRSITFFYNPDKDRGYQVLDKIKWASEILITAFRNFGYEVQTTRLVTPPFPTYMLQMAPESAVEFAVNLEQAARERGCNYIALGPALLSNPASFDAIYPILASTQNTFLSAEIATGEDGISLPAIRACAAVIRKAAGITPDGFANLRFAALANMVPGGPFFPSSYHYQPNTSFSLAIETAGEAQHAFENATSISEGRRNLLTSLEHHGGILSRISEENSQLLNLEFCGIDFSLAPFPSLDCSIARAIENFGVSRIGMLGSTAAAAILAETLDRGSWKKAGFNGLMFPVLEDSYLAEASINQSLSIKDLLLFSTVCGTGLDTVPLPGDISEKSIAAILLDVSALALRLDKPLTARLMPVPGKSAGELTEFDFEYFDNGSILDVPSDGLSGLFSGSESFELKNRKVWR